MTQPHVGIRADATPTMGVGHVVRCLALAEELLERGAEVTLLGTVDVEWLARLIESADIAVVPVPDPAADVVALAVRLGVDALVVDGYGLDPRIGSTARAAGMTVLALHDGPFGADQDADVYLDQNFGAVPHPAGDRGRVSLAGVEHALFRGDVLALADRPRPAPSPAGVLAVFGGTDPFGAAAVVVPLVLATGVPLELTCIVARPELREAVERLPTAPGQTVRVLAPTPDVMALAARSTATVSAAGSSIWELLHLGVPTGIVAVADNQEPTYADVTSQGVVAPVGLLAELRDSPEARAEATSVLRRLLTDTTYQERLGHRARTLVDGQGRRRVVDALLACLDPLRDHRG